MLVVSSDDRIALAATTFETLGVVQTIKSLVEEADVGMVVH